MCGMFFVHFCPFSKHASKKSASVYKRLLFGNLTVNSRKYFVEIDKSVCVYMCVRVLTTHVAIGFFLAFYSWHPAGYSPFL